MSINVCLRDPAFKKYLILTVSKLCVTVTAPHAAIPPAMKELSTGQQG